MPALSWRGRLLPVTLAILLVLAGCSVGDGTSPSTPSTVLPTATDIESSTTTGTTAGPSSATTTAPEPEIPPGHVAVEGGTLPVNATLIFQRVEGLLGVDADPPRIRIEEGGTSRDGASGSPLERDLTFERRLGIAPPENGTPAPPSGLGGGAMDDEVRLVFYDTTPDAVDRARLELVVAHEFVHVIQFQRREDRKLTAARETRTAMLEGGAVFVTDRYARQYDLTYPGETLPIERWIREYRTQSPWHWTLGAQYHFGAQYLERRIDEADDLWAVYDDPPETMEQVIHGDAAGSPRPLQVSADAPEWTVTHEGTQGEHVALAVLRVALEYDAAVTAAAGWGNDELLEFEPRDDQDLVGHAWVLRWDDAGEADAFEDALQRVIVARSAAIDASFSVVLVAPETVVLLVGPPAFVDRATVSGTNESVTVALNSNASGRIVRGTSSSVAGAQTTG